MVLQALEVFKILANRRTLLDVGNVWILRRHSFNPLRPLSAGSIVQQGSDGSMAAAGPAKSGYSSSVVFEGDHGRGEGFTYTTSPAGVYFGDPSHRLSEAPACGSFAVALLTCLPKARSDCNVY